MDTDEHGLFGWNEMELTTKNTKDTKRIFQISDFRFQISDLRSEISEKHPF